jgi:hypothetical protein
MNELESNSKNIRDLYRGMNEFKKGYKPRTNFAKDERGNLLADSYKILNRRKNYFCQLLNVHGAGGVRQTECIQLNHLCQSVVHLRLSLLLGS